MSRKTVLLVVLLALIVVVSGCGGIDNDTPLDAAKVWARAMVEADPELMDQINRSHLGTTSQLMQLANDHKWIGLDHGKFQYEVDPHSNNLVQVKHPDLGRSYRVFLRYEAGKWYFVDCKW